MNLSIIIVHYKNQELLKLCLKSIKNNLMDKSINPETPETIVIDSQAQAETEELISENFNWVKYFPFKQNIGYAAGVNQGLKTAQQKNILILNPDIIITPGSVEKMIAHLESNSAVGLLGPKLLNFNGQTQNSCFRFYKPATVIYRRTFLGKTFPGKRELAKFNLSDADKNSLIYPDWLMGSALLTTKKAVEKVGLMDERFKLYFEDVDWAKRFWENGYKVVYFPESFLLHYHIRRSKAGLGFLDVFLRKETRWHIQSAIKYFFKHGLKYGSGIELLKANLRECLFFESDSSPTSFKGDIL